MSTVKPLYVAWVMALALQAGAETIDAVRYIDPHGVEIIQNRPRPAQAASAGVMPTVANRPHIEEASSATHAHVSVAEQAERDKVRAQVLNEELMTEAGALANDWKQLHGPARMTDDQQVAKLQHSIADHESNIRQINAELRRVKKS